MIDNNFPGGIFIDSNECPSTMIGHCRNYLVQEFPVEIESIFQGDLVVVVAFLHNARIFEFGFCEHIKRQIGRDCLDLQVKPNQLSYTASLL